MLKNVLTAVYVAVFIMLIYIFQIFVIDQRLLLGVKPNLILIFTIVVSLFLGLYKGAFFSFCIGILTDIIFGSSFGIFTISYTITGILVGYLNNNYRKENKMALVYITIISTATFEFVEYISYLMTTSIYGNMLYLIKQIIISSVLNIIIVYLIYSFLFRAIEYFENRIDRRNYF